MPEDVPQTLLFGAAVGHGEKAPVFGRGERSNVAVWALRSAVDE